VSEEPKKSRWPGIAIRVGVSGALVAVLIATTDLDVLWSYIVGANLTYFAIGVAIWTASTVFMALRWRYMLAVDGVEASYGSLLFIYLESHFFGVFLPSAVGGDVYRGVRVYRLIGGAGKATINLLAERMIGVWAVCVHGGFSLLITGTEHGDVMMALVVVLVLVVAASYVVVAKPGQALVRWLLQLLRLKRLEDLHTNISKQVAGYFSHHRLVAVLMGISLCQQLLSISVAYLCGLAAGAELGFGFYMMAMPVVWVLSLLPAIGGVGPREAALVVLMTGAGISKEVALAAAALLLGAQLGRGVFGGLLYLARSIAGRGDDQR
jgi:uncharacterized protein (TIRG00374 family)